MRVIGPNIIGVLSNSDKMNASFTNFLPPLDGKAALVSQSGALLIAMDAATYTRRVGFDKMISIGNQADLDFADLIAYLNEDENTTCITLYIEGIKDGARFMEEARKCTKPIIALKAGTSAMVPRQPPLILVLWQVLPKFMKPHSSKLVLPRLKI